jgi:hypothetical protein
MTEAAMKYALLIYAPSTAEEYAAMEVANRDGTGRGGAWVDFTRAVQDAGVLVAAEQLTHSETAASVRVRGEDRLITDGPAMETKEHLLGFWVVDVPDLDAALEWASQMPAASVGTIEVRAAMSGMAWQRALD